MLITKLRLFHYRNIDEQEITPCSGTSLFTGKNGQGKTNILESIYFLAYGRSFRTGTPRDCIQHGQKECLIEGTVEHGQLRRELKVSISNKEKTLFVFGKPAALDEFTGNLHLLAFTHEHMNVVRGGPADRRAFLDRAMVNLFPGHLRNLAMYGRAVKQRNRIMASIRDGTGHSNEKLMDSWDEALVKPGTRILCNRIDYVNRMKEQMPQGLFGDDNFRIHYLSTVTTTNNDVHGLEEVFRQRLRQTRDRDGHTGYTSVGPHRDDLRIYVNGKSLVDFGSAGQQRSCLLTLYFAQMEVHVKTHGYYPVFLVDDAEAELDEIRLNTFLQYLSLRTQTILTSARNFSLSSMSGSRCFFVVENGSVTASGRD
ncbi:MAG TPA: DNA replication/repair protein RecF [Acidobacteriota bacterium]|nr:DNA replication/repair protein RecF [Acidobacteriota bacterium]